MTQHAWLPRLIVAALTVQVKAFTVLVTISVSR
jgi:hypothetical protein